jgi:hypothetical protein
MLNEHYDEINSKNDINSFIKDLVVLLKKYHVTVSGKTTNGAIIITKTTGNLDYVSYESTTGKFFKCKENV